MHDLNQLNDKAISGTPLSDDELYSLLDINDKEALYQAAECITRATCSRQFDSCSIANVKSGRCPENCKWCAQSAHYSTGCDTYDIINREQCLEMAADNAAKGVKRFSLVASGRALKGDALRQVCDLFVDIKHLTGIFTCASLGLLDSDALQQLWNAGVRRYHCNLETAPSHFATLCTTHTIDDKIATIDAARAIGFEICSGCIIGMGESARQRVEFAITLRRVNPVSIPVNILCPIPGTPLADTPPLSDDDILTALSIMRFAHPGKQIRLAGGRSKMSRETQQRAMRIAVNGSIVGDLLTTVGSTIDSDRKLVADSGYDF